MANSDLKTQVQTQFGRVAANYSASAVHQRGPELAQMLALAALNGNENLLDAGCGTGHTALYFAPHVQHVIALDMTAPMLAQAEQLASERALHNISFCLGDVEHLTMPDHSLDVVVSRYSAHHWQNPRQALQEFRRVLKPGGKFLLFDTVGSSDATCDTFLQSIELLRDTSHVRDHSPAEWLRMLNETGFQAQCAGQWRLFLQFEQWVTRIATPPDQVAMIRKLFSNAPSHVRDYFELQPDHSFSLDTALFLAS